MDDEVVNLVSCGSIDFPRFMIFHGERNLFWNKGRWRSNWRNGEMWDCPGRAENELKQARTFADQFEIGDE